MKYISKKSLLLFCVIFISVNIVAEDDFAKFQRKQNNSFDSYSKKNKEEFANYKKLYNDAYKKFSKELGKKWPQTNNKPLVSTNHKWVSYDKDLNSRKIVDFKSEKISLDVIASSEKEAKVKLKKMLKKLFTVKVKDGVKNDQIEQAILKKLKTKPKKIITNQSIIGDMLTKKDKKQLTNKLIKQKLIKVKFKNKFIYKANVKLPPNAILKKAKTYKNIVNENAKKQKLPASLIYAIMHSESSFNPMARSYVPAFGLMQIVPRSAGIDSYRYLYGKKKMLSSYYLYNSNNNIKIGSGYLHILYFNYLKKIKNPQSRLYCTIAAYNTGAGNVAKVFSGTTNINKASKDINRLNADQVYKQLMRKLPYNETKKYLLKVSKRESSYRKIVGTIL